MGACLLLLLLLLLLQGSAALTAQMRVAFVKMLPARYWALWAAEFSSYLTR